MKSETAAVASHFPDARTQRDAARLGMWIFLATEVLLFAGLFVSYAYYRHIFPAAFAAGSDLLDLTAGTVNTVILVTSSFTVALAAHHAAHGHGKLSGILFAVSIALALAFLGVKTTEYLHKIHEGILPGRSFAMEEPMPPGTAMFLTVYFVSTGLHAIHVIAGTAVLAWVGWRAFRGEFSEAYSTPAELAGMYWHLVDLVWIFLFPLLYLV